MSRLRLECLLVVDIERTCWEGEVPEGECSDIIEIGVAEVQLRGSSVGAITSAGYMVRPRRSRVSEFCTNLTGITQDMVASARPFQEVVGTIRKAHGSLGKTWGAWGRDDQDIAESCGRLGVTSPFSTNFMNIGSLWGLFSGATRNVGLTQALSQLGLQFEGAEHRAEPDAVNAARVFAHIANLVRQDTQGRTDQV